ncbi:tRNA (N6-threonylcarbamoyladenosine(37)-N6)-methyltransferase TrmO [Rhodospirillum sp. A1_3_36]|uniref:tRNA (N6-threonylcarbamoyladenosine(37)-N6)-methyltransferase TrmO n=1 Tax=Rhodospirillum sp. A1_3_36 TaxID=3391666 RepID=UPI0039A42C42
MDSDIREGEVALDFDPGAKADGSVSFIGWIQTPWKERGSAPRNLIQARERTSEPAHLVLQPAYGPGLSCLEGYSHVVVLYWMDRARRDLILQWPRHSDRARGVFSLRSPVRPNPIALGIVPLLGVDQDMARVTVGPLDCLDGTPLLDIKPYHASTDAYPNAVSS